MGDHRPGARVLGKTSRNLASDLSRRQLGAEGSGFTPGRRPHTLAIGTLLLPIVALILSSSACQNPTPSHKDSAVVRADSLDAARAAYDQAAQKLPQLSDWLYLRAAGVTGDSAARAAYYAKLR